MAGRIDLPNESQLEIWELQVPGTVWVWVYDRRNDRYKKQRIGGRGGGGSKKLTISMGDRRYNQEQVIDEMRDHDPFSNGALLRISGPELDETEEYLTDVSNHKSNEDLLEFFELTDAALFQEAIESLTSETVIRRLYSLGRTHALAWQMTALDELIQERYRVGGTQSVVAEMLAANDLQGGHALS